MWKNELIFLFISLLLAICGGIFLKWRGHKNFTYGLVCLITSFFFFFLGSSKFIEEITQSWILYQKIILYVGIALFAVIAFFTGYLYGGHRLLQGPIQVAVLMSVALWFILRDASYSWQDIFIFLGLTFFISAAFMKKRRSTLF